jgi:hypothetical protein
LDETEDWSIKDGESAIFELEFDQLPQYEAIKKAQKEKF